MKFLITVENCIKIANCTKASHVERKSFECNMYITEGSVLLKWNLCVYDTSPTLHNGTYLNCNSYKKNSRQLYICTKMNLEIIIIFLTKYLPFLGQLWIFCLFCREMSSEAGIPLLPSLCKVK